MADTQYDVSHQMKKLFELKQQKRKATKEYFQKLIYNPYRPAVDTVPFDPAVFRFASLTSYSIEHFRPTSKTILGSFFLFIVPFSLIYCVIRSEKKEQEAQIRSGLVPYKDRKFKLYL